MYAANESHAAAGQSRPERKVLMQPPEDVDAILGLKRAGWGIERIAKHMRISKNTVRRYVRLGGWEPYKRPERERALDKLQDWLRERFHRHGGNADVLRQELEAEKGVTVSLRTVERAVEPYRAELAAAARATLRFETPPGQQLQIDFGTKAVLIDGEVVSVKLFVATLGYSRRIFVRAMRNERQSAWFGGLEGAFMHFGGVTRDVLLDNAKALVKHHNPQTREVVFNDRFVAFCKHWGVVPKACAPYRARTKGKDERAVGYVKRNAIAGRRFGSWEQLDAHLARWMRDVADARVHAVTGERPADRFAANELEALLPLASRPPFAHLRELQRKVGSDAFVDVDTNRYSVPWRLIGEMVTVLVDNERVRVQRATVAVANHVKAVGQRQMVRDPAHFVGIGPKRASAAGSNQAYEACDKDADGHHEAEFADLQRDLGVYESAAGGAW